jgi:hypothetical protein
MALVFSVVHIGSSFATAFATKSAETTNPGPML